MKKFTLFSLLIILLGSTQLFSQNHWHSDLSFAQTLAKDENKLILIDFYADWCQPCTKMDMEVWSQADMKENLDKFILVRINIDIDKQSASMYHVEAIPYVVVTDFQGEQFLESLGAKDLSSSKQMLEGFPASVENIYAALLNLESNSDDAMANIAVAEAYELEAETLDQKTKLLFIKHSNSFLGKASKISGKQKETVLSEKIELMKLLNKAELNTGKKTIFKFFAKNDIKDMDASNRSLACYILAKTHLIDENKEACNECLTKLKEMGDTFYSKKLELALNK